ncbi:MAG: AAA family ATPase [Candidatus Omnitrophica bacterium]|nr:AAA family ATPase [Candidatus Omnitrophota bacterium]
MEFRVAIISSKSKVNYDLTTILAREIDRVKGDKLSPKIFSTPPSMEEMVHFTPHLIVVCLEPQDKDEGLEFLSSLSRIADRIPVIICGAQFEADLMLSCIKKGVRDFLKYPLQDTEVREMLQRLIREVPSIADANRSGISYIFFSYKGGLGTTFLACNMAVAIARLKRARVLLWDLVIQNGDVPFFFDYEPTVTLSDLLENSGRIDEVYLRASLPIHPSGVCILAGPKRPEEAEVIRNDQLQGLHQTLHKFYDYIVIDGGHSLTDQIISAMDSSKYIMLTTDLHLPVLKNTLRCLEVFERLGYNQQKFKILLNRYNSKYQKFDLAKAEEILRYPITYAIANDYVTVSRSLNTGIPVADLDGGSMLAKQFEGLGKLVLADFKLEEKKDSSSLLGGLKGMFEGGRSKKDKQEHTEAKDKKGNVDVRKNGKTKKEEKSHAA